jgi:hypothetical protein
MTVHLCLVLRVRMTGAVFLLALYLSDVLMDNFTFYIAWDCNYFSILYFSQEQATLKAKQRMLREDWELFKAQRKLLQQKMWNKTARYCMMCVCVCLCMCCCLMLQCCTCIRDFWNSLCQWYSLTSGNLLDFVSTSTIEYGLWLLKAQ